MENQHLLQNENTYIKKINQKIFWGLLFLGLGTFIIIIIMIIGLARINSSLNQFDNINISTFEETANNFNQIMSNNGTEKIILLLDSMDINTITNYMIKVKNIINEACYYFFKC